MEVWIETHTNQEYLYAKFVTSHVEVWIETHATDLFPRWLWSPPTWRCGLKLSILARMKHLLMSPPTWRCGLKLVTDLSLASIIASPPTWRCGLKHSWRLLDSQDHQVTSHVEVWIET